MQATAKKTSRPLIPASLLVWLCLLLCLGATLAAQISAQPLSNTEKRYRFDTWTTDHGLPSGVVNAILQTTDGYLWLGTANGLVRFDGIRFTPFNKPEFVSSRISVLYEDGDGILWIGTEGGGLMSYKDGVFKNYSVASGLAGESVSAINSDDRGTVWVATVGGGLNRFRSGEFTPFTPKSDLNVGTIEALLSDGQDGLWWSSGNTLGKFNEGEFETIPRGAEDRVRLGVATASGFWLLEKNTLRRWSAGEPTDQVWELPDELEASQVSTIYRDRDGDIWIGTAGLGLYRAQDGKFTRYTTNDGLSQNSILSITQDREGNLWIGTNGGGLNRMRESAFDIFDTRRGLSQNVVLSISGGRDGSIWMGTDGGGLTRLRDGQVMHYGPQQGLRNSQVWSVLEDSAGNVWAGTHNGLYKFTGVKFVRVAAQRSKTDSGNGLPSQDVRALYEDRKGRLWAGTFGGGVTRLVDDRASSTFSSRSHPEVFSSNDIRAMLEDSDGNFWIGTGGGGLVRLKDSQFSVIRRRDGLSSDFIRAIFEDSEGDLWIGTNNGLSLIHKSRLYRFSTANRLPDDVISQIFEDNRGNLWFGSNRGVFRISRRALISFAEGRVPSYNSVLYDRSDGLAARECNGGFQPWGWKDAEGRLWVPSSSGASIIDPENLRINTRPPQVMIEGVVADGLDLDSRRITNSNAGEIQTVYRVPPGTERLEFHYTGLSFVAPRRVRFSYQLQGIDQGWVDGENLRTVRYQEVPPGRYEFSVLAANSDGVWNSIGKSVGVIVLPRFYQTLWFKISSVLFIGFVGFTFFRYLSVRKLRHQLVLLEHQSALDRERSRIAQDMHDDLGARITRIGLLTELVRRKAPQSDDIKGLSARIDTATREVVHTLDEIVWAVNPKNDTLDRLAAYITQYAEDYFEITPIRCRLDVPTGFPSVSLSAELRHSLFLVVKESLNNIVKHSEASEVRIGMSYDRPHLEISIEDNGKGFSLEEANPARNGLVNMKKRIEEGGGKFDLTSTKGKGTRIVVRIKLST